MQDRDNAKGYGKSNAMGVVGTQVQAKGSEQVQDQLCHDVLPDPSEAKTGDGDTELGSRQIGIEVGNNVLREGSHGMALARFDVDLRGPYLNDCKFRSDKETIEKNEKKS